MKHHVWLPGVLVSLSVTVAQSQTCLGRASFGRGAARVGANYHSVSVYGGELGYGKSGSLFGIAQGDAWESNRDPSSASWKRLMATGGYQVVVKNSGLELCPVASLGHYFSGRTEGPNYSSDYSGQQYEIGGAIGYGSSSASDWTVVPSFAMKFVRQSASGTWMYNGQVLNGHPPAYHYGVSTFTLGITGNGVTISPFLDHRFGIRYTTTQWGLGLAYNVGRK